MIVTMFSIVAIIIYTHTHARRYMPNRHYNIKGKSGTCLFVVRYTGHGADVHLCFLYFVACNQPKDLVVDAGESYKHNTLYGHRSPRWSHFFCFFLLFLLDGIISRVVRPLLVYPLVFPHLSFLDFYAFHSYIKGKRKAKG